MSVCMALQPFKTYEGDEGGETPRDHTEATEPRHMTRHHKNHSSDGVRQDDTRTKHWFLPPLNPLLREEAILKSCARITPVGYDRRPVKTQPIQGWHDVHRPLVLHKDPTGAKKIRRGLEDLLPDYPHLVSLVQGCSSEFPCGVPICPYCSLSVGVRNACLMFHHISNPIAFTLLMEPLTEDQFATQVLVGKVTTGGRTMDNLADARWANKNLSSRLKKHAGKAKMILMPDVDWDPEKRLFKPHYHGVVDASQEEALGALREAYPGQVVFSRPLLDPLGTLKYLNYGHKIPVLRWKHLKELHRLKEDRQISRFGSVRGVNRLLLLWKALRPPALLLGFERREDTGKIRSGEFALTTALRWKACKDPS